MSNIDPALNLQFAENQLLDSRIEFSRNSIATRINEKGYIELVEVNEPRFDYDPYTLECLGLLFESQRINLIPYSDQANVWGSLIGINNPVTTNVIAAPDGTMTAEKFIEDTSTGGHALYRSGTTVTNATDYVYSVFVKAGERTVIILSATVGSNVYATFDLTAGTIGTKTATTAWMFPHQDGWYRCAILFTSVDVTVNCNNYLVSGGTNTYTGDGTSGAYVWGPQLEEGTFPSSYIPTGSSAVTRYADLASITGDNFTNTFSKTEGTLIFELAHTGVRPNNTVFFQMTDGTAANAMASFYSGTDPSYITLASTKFGSANTGYLGGVQTFATRTFAKYGYAYTTTTVTRAAKGSVSTDTSADVPPVDRFMFYKAVGNGGTQDYWYRSLLYFPKSLTTAELQGLTV